MAIVLQRTVSRINLAWDGDAFKGGEFSEITRVVDDETGEDLIPPREENGIPIAGAVQPGRSLSQLLGETEAQRITSLANERARVQRLEQQVTELGQTPVELVDRVRGR